MEKEIEKLKKEYLDTPVPEFLKTSGISDVFIRVEKGGLFNRFYLRRYSLIAVLILIAFTFFIGYAQAASPGTPLYPLKQLTVSAISKFTGQKTQDVEKEINKIMNVPSPTPTPKENFPDTQKDTNQNSTPETQKTQVDKIKELNEVNKDSTQLSNKNSLNVDTGKENNKSNVLNYENATQSSKEIKSITNIPQKESENSKKDKSKD